MPHLPEHARLAISAALFAFVAAVPASATAGTLETPPTLQNEINVTSDSPRGWLPAPEQREQALARVRAFLDAIEGGRYDEAYRMQAPPNRERQSQTQFAQDEAKFRTIAGPLKSWRVLKITWTKDPPRGPFPGVYAAIDLAGRFLNADRDCGYIVVYKSPQDREFTVMRRENNYLDNTTAQKIEAQKSKAEVENVWRQLSRYCPNY